MTITFVTTTSHGTWLPGNSRGYVHNGVILPGDKDVLAFSELRLKTPPVFFSPIEREQLFAALCAGCDEFGYKLSDAAVESWHLHWILFHGDDAIDRVIGRLKTRMRQRLERGKIWTEGYCAEPLLDDNAVEQAAHYIARHTGCRMTDGRFVHRVEPRQSRGLPTPK